MSLEFNPAGVNEELRQSRRWVLWQLEDVQDGEKLRKNAKVPKNARTGDNARHNDPSTWGTYDEALDAHLKNLPLQPDKNSVTVHPTRGIGCVIGPPFFAIDIDDCRNAETGDITEEARSFIDELNTLTEISPSGTGVHMWGHGEPPYKEGHRKDGREIYSTNRYLTVTGKILFGRSEIRRFTKQEVVELYARVKAGRYKPMTANTPNAKLADLMTRVDFPDLSQAVMSLLTLLAIETLCDPTQMEARFKQSKLYTDTHWKEKWERLGPGHVVKACEYARENLQKRRSNGDESSTRKLLVECAHGTLRKPLRFLWPGRLQIGTINHFAGQQGQAKTPAAIDVLARTTRGAVWPDGQSNTFGPRCVLSMSDEDAFESVWLPRFDLADGDDHLLYRVKGVEITRLSREGNVLSTSQGLTALSTDLHLLIEQAKEIPNLMVILIDPITAYLGKNVKMNEEQSVRDVLTPLSMFAEQQGLVVITIGHLNKNESKDPLMRMMGAAAFTGVARIVYSVGPDQEATGNDAKYRHILAPVRGATKGSLKYHTEMVEQEYDGEKSEVVKIVWDGATDQDAESTMTTVSRREQSEVNKAAKLLREFLAGGRRRIQECKGFLKDNGHDLDKLKADRVKEAARVEHKKDGKEWYWFVVTGQTEVFEAPVARQDDSVPGF